MTPKSFYIENSLLQKVKKLKEKNEKANALNKIKKSFSIKTWSRSATILPDFIDLRFQVYNGKNFVPITITPEKVGLKLGEFVPTRAKYEFKKKKKKKK